jgi:Reverse transcriptase (RNA-dependent DNA polymerase)
MLKTVRVLLALTARFGWHTHHMDVKTAFLNPDLSHEVYMLQPKGYERGNRVCLLLKALYGLKQASREWYTDINKFLRSIGFTNAMTDANLYLAQGLLLLLFVDDMLIFASAANALKELKHQLISQYEMTDLGEVRQFLGLQIYRNYTTKTLHINQSQYINRVLQRFGLQDCNGAKTPMEPNADLRAGDLEA